MGFFTGLFYSTIRKMESRPLVPQAIAVVGAYLVQAPYVFVTDTYLMGMPAPVVFVIMGVLALEDVVSVFICHAVLYRIDIRKALSK